MEFPLLESGRWLLRRDPGAGIPVADAPDPIDRLAWMLFYQKCSTCASAYPYLVQISPSGTRYSSIHLYHIGTHGDGVLFGQYRRESQAGSKIR